MVEIVCPKCGSDWAPLKKDLLPLMSSCPKCWNEGPFWEDIQRAKKQAEEEKLLTGNVIQDQLTALFSIWPQASDVVCQKFVLDTCGVQLQHTALDAARQRVGLIDGSQATSTEQRDYAEYFAAALISRYGINGLSKDRLVGQVYQMLSERFGATCVDVGTVEHWVSNVAKQISQKQGDLGFLMKVLAEKKALVDKYGQ